MAKDIAIIGMSVEVPEARNIHDFWQLIRTGRTLTRPFPAQRRADIEQYVEYQRDSAIAEWTERNISFHDGAYLDRVDSFEPEFFQMTPKQASVADPHQRLILRNMYLALEDAGYTGERVAGSRTGVYVGFAANPGSSYLEYCCRIDPTLTQLGLTGNITTMLANRLSYLMDLRGPSMVVDSACSASLVAVHLAVNALLAGDCEMAVVAGSRIVLAPVQHPNTRIGIESSDGMTRTFDEAADGTGYGEGSGVVVLKPLDRAVADGDQIHAVIKGSAVNHDGHSSSMTTPDAAAQARLLLAAWSDAGIAPETVGYLEAHGTATRVGDPIEFDGLQRAFREHSDATGFCAVGTVKANIGHLFEGSGVVGLIKAVLTLREREVPPLAGLTTPNPRLDFANAPVYLPTSAQPWPQGATPRRAGVSAFGLGGTNSHVVLEEYAGQPPAATPGAGPYLFTLSARTETSLRRLVDRYLDWLGEGPAAGKSLADICWTTNVSRAGHRKRIAFVVRDVAELRAHLAAYADGAPVPAAPAPDELATLRDDYLAGADADLLAPYRAARPRIVGLPGYEFDEQRCWVDFPADWAARWGGGSRPEPVSYTQTHEVGFAPTDPAPAGDPAEARVLALVDPECAAGTALDAALPAGATVLRLGEDFQLDEADLERVADDAIDEEYTHVVHALAVEATPAGDLATFDARVHKNLTSLLMLGKALMAAGGRLTFTVLTRRAVAVTAGEPEVVTENGSLVGLAKSIAREYPYLTVRVVDVSDDVPAERLRDELLCAEPGVYVLRGETRYHEYFAELPEVQEPGQSRPYLRSGGAYLITGGTGAIGLAIARSFAAAQPDVHLTLLSRSGLPEPAEWDAVLAADPDSAVAGRIRAVREMTALGAEVTVSAVDVADPEQLAAVVAGIRQRHGRVDGIVHAAGVPGNNPVVDQDVAQFASVLRPKMHGAFLLDQLTADDRPDFVLHLSSVAASMPALGQSDYAAANFYLDNLAMANTDPNCHVLAIDWVAWKEIGMAVDYGIGEDMSFKAIPTAQGVALVDSGLRSRRRRIFAGEINYGNELMNFITLYPLAIEPVIRERIATGMAQLEERSRVAMGRIRDAIASTTVELAGRPDGGYTAREWMVGRCVAHAFGFSTVDVEADFRDMGADSVSALTVATHISACLGTPFDAIDLLTERTVAGVARFIDEMHGPMGDDLAIADREPVAAG
ncbi:type I polyketide synthase [Actinoplanes teichomyceticus]|uniref:Polyketide synthase PksL n=1 Tax=Actinoplanes teichomyceticus TaxID=1867 RepID=A0A561VGQ9_ACTTI|nr:type I polyketide synthase [Actinoplanes teichomyceticus]TWG10810.1 polyketide synthase PksL [Actinoplanes teichomyceticus]GIF12569.1 hypothetical protein Ate01nite_26010 [Actinoplanes teichomyceticus]